MKIYTREDIEELLSVSSFSGLIFLYACHLSYKNTISFKMAEFIKDTKLSSTEDYLYGFIVACASFNIIEYHINRNIINIIKINEFIGDVSKSEINERINNMEDVNLKNEFKDLLANTDSFFAIAKYN